MKYQKRLTLCMRTTSVEQIDQSLQTTREQIYAKYSAHKKTTLLFSAGVGHTGHS